MPAGFPYVTIGIDLHGPGSLQHFGGTRNPMRDHPFTVFAQPGRLSSARGMPFESVRFGSRVTQLTSSRQILTADANQDSAAVVLLEGFVVTPTPGNISTQYTVGRNVDRWQTASNLQRIPANEVTVRIGFIKFLAENANALRPQVRIHCTVQRALNHAPGMKHQILADKP